MKDQEHKEQVALMRWLQLQHPKAYELTYAIPNGGQRNAAVGAKLKREGVKKGVPDICMAYPINGFHGLYIEYKTAKGKPTSEQLEWLDKLAKMGYCAVLCKGLDVAMNTINGYLTVRKHSTNN